MPVLNDFYILKILYFDLQFHSYLTHLKWGNEVGNIFP